VRFGASEPAGPPVGPADAFRTDAPDLRRGPTAVRLTLLSRAYCHLCDEMLQSLVPIAGDTPVDVIDVDAPEHAALEALFGDAVPVLFLGAPAQGNELCRYRLDAARVASALAAAVKIR
jgi:hypothetical protein